MGLCLIRVGRAAQSLIEYKNFISAQLRTHTEFYESTKLRNEDEQVEGGIMFKRR